MLSSSASGAQLERERLLRLLDSLRLKKRLQVDASCCNGCLFAGHVVMISRAYTHTLPFPLFMQRSCTHTHTHTHTHAHTHTHTHTRDADTFEYQAFHDAFGKLLKSLEGADAPPSISGARSKVAILVH